MLRLLTLLTNFLFVFCQSDPTINLPNGQIRGVSVTTLRNKVNFYAYMGIPFAAPPVGNLRFQPPQAVANWDGVLDVTSNTRSCYQITSHTVHGQSEDCLYLNIYTTAEPGETNASLPVLVKIYGGSFTHGSASGDIYGPQHLIENGLIVVTFNYRVGPFGFLSTEDSIIPGNMGLKDQQFVLKWVQTNIHLFGGDPSKVTIQGQSAGAASVTFHILSPLSAGLFRAAISSSGSALCSWAYQRNAKNTALGIATLIDPSFNSNKSEDILKLLLSVDAEVIHDTQNNYPDFAPVIEQNQDGAMITENMYESLKNGKINKVPLYMGFNSEEYLVLAADLNSLKTRMTAFDDTPAKLVSPSMNVQDSETAKSVGELIRTVYTSGLFEDNLGPGVQYMSDDTFTRANIRYAQMQANFTDVYFYEFSYHGEMGRNDISYPGIGKVEHGEDGRYFWATNVPLSSYPKSDIKTMDRYVQSQANFVKYLNPTPEKTELFQNLSWPKVVSDNFYYLNIDTDLSIEHNPRGSVYQKWVAIFNEYAQEPFITY